jgi:AcrR family transcriptional regulator
MGPRRPVRANGRRRFESLLDAAERVLQSGGTAPLTIRNIAREAGVPMASVYHFLPHPSAVSVALSERYLEGLEARICAPIARNSTRHWARIIAILIRRGVGFYRDHPYAQQLILGSDHSWTIRRADLANNRRIADAIATFLAGKFPQVEQQCLLDAVVTGITIADAVFALSIAEHGRITDRLARESWCAVCGYLAARFRRAPPPPSHYSINIEEC